MKRQVNASITCDSIHRTHLLHRLYLAHTNQVSGFTESDMQFVKDNRCLNKTKHLQTCQSGSKNAIRAMQLYRSSKKRIIIQFVGAHCASNIRPDRKRDD